MANQKRPSQSKPNIQCKKHPKHKQSPGVCSLCLREKLSQISTSSSRSTSNTMGSSCSTSSLSSCSSSSASSYSSPLHRYRFTTTEGKGTLSLLFNGKSLLTKSRSLAFVPRMRSKESDDVKNKKGGFWSKLIHPRRKRIDEGLVHSRTVREIVIQTS